MAVENVLGAKPAWFAEMAPGPSMILAHRFPKVPNLGDLNIVPWNAIRPVDILTAGIPCQSSSIAGLRKGRDDERWLWPGIQAAIGGMEPRPRLLLLECVLGLLSVDNGDALGAVIHGLASLGYVGRYGIFRAADAGAPHARARWFCVAYPASTGLEGFAGGGEPGAWRAPVVASGCAVADPVGRDFQRRGVAGVVGSPQAGEPRQGDQRERAGHAAERGGGAAADAGGAGSEGLLWPDWPDQEGDWAALSGGGHVPDGSGDGIEWGTVSAAIDRWEQILGRPAPRPTLATGRNGELRLSAKFVEFMMGLPEGWVTEVPGLSRREQLTALGNGVVPQQAEMALRALLPIEVRV